MKNFSFFLFLVLSISLFGQRNFEQSLAEAHSFHGNAQMPEGFLLETDYVPTYYRLEMNMNPYQSDFSGKTTMHFVVETETQKIEINAQENLNIGLIQYHGQPITNFFRTGNVLTINLPEIIPTNALDSISISFSGNADSSLGLNLGQHAGVPIMETISEPWRASSWWVCKDDLLDKPTKVDVLVTHPSEFKAASIGLIQSVTPLGNGNTRTHWQHNYAIPTYLIAAAVTNYTEYNHTANVNGTIVPIINYVYPETLSNWAWELDQVPSYVEFFSQKFGDYPYKLEKYGHAQWNRNGGMEHATMSFMGNFNFGLIGHELAHQWFGNQVTCKTWHDIWVNEGFAEYGDGILVEHVWGANEFLNWKTNNVGLITADPTGSVWNPDAENQSRIFNYRLSYAKGSMVVHLMRYVLNDDDLFFLALRNFLNDPNFTYGFAGTEDVKMSLEATTGLDWDPFFADWIYGEGHPIFDINVNNLPNSTNLTVQIQQSSSHSSVSFFETPFEIEFQGASGETTIRRFNLTPENTSFSVTNLPFEVVSYVPNPKSDVIAVIESTTMNNKEFDLDKSNEMKMYPNPTSNQFTLEFKNPIDAVKVFDRSGKLMYEKQGIQSKIWSHSTQSWPKGVYMIQVQSGRNIQLKKLLVE